MRASYVSRPADRLRLRPPFNCLARARPYRGELAFAKSHGALPALPTEENAWGLHASQIMLDGYRLAAVVKAFFFL